MLRIKEIIEEKRKKGENISLIDLGRELWPGVDVSFQRNSISKLANNKRKTIDIAFIPILCRVLDCEINELFDFKNVKNGDR